MILAQITAPHFCAGLVLDDDERVVEAAPIIGYMKENRWTRDMVRDYCTRRGWRVAVVSQSSQVAGEHRNTSVSIRSTK
jgi:protein subunit release factor A